MHPIVLFLISLGAARLAGLLARRESISAVDLAIGVIGWLVSLSMVQFLGAGDAGVGPGLTLLIAFGLPIGLQSLQRRSLLR